MRQPPLASRALFLALLLALPLAMAGEALAHHGNPQAPSAPSWEAYLPPGIQK